MDSRLPYLTVNGIELLDVQKQVNELMQSGYIPQQMVVSAIGVNYSRPRYIVPMLLKDFQLQSSTEKE